MQLSVVSIVSDRPEPPAAYKARLADIAGLSHAAIEGPRVPPRASSVGEHMVRRSQVLITALGLCLAVSGCVSVRQADLDSWVGQPVVTLEKHPVFLTMPVVRTVASDGTEIRNYINGRNIGHCSGGGSILGTNVDFATYSNFQ